MVGIWSAGETGRSRKGRVVLILDSRRRSFEDLWKGLFLPPEDVCISEKNESRATHEPKLHTLFTQVALALRQFELNAIERG